MKRVVIAVLLVTSGLAGCIGSEDTDPADAAPTFASSNVSVGFGDPVTVMDECTDDCSEPTVAVDPAGRVFVAEADGPRLVRSTDGGTTFEHVGTPPLPDTIPPGAIQKDNLVQIGPDGSLYFSTLVVEEAGYAVQVARSDDGGESWAVNQVIWPANDPTTGTIVPDRQWLGFGQDGVVYLTYWEALLGPVVVSHRSQDRGETWSSPSVVATAAERLGGTGGSGPPVVDSKGRVYIPLHANTRDPDAPQSVDVAVSEDGGRSWQTQEAFRTAGGCDIPILAVDERDRLHLASNTCSDLVVTTSTDGAETWSEPVSWAQDPAIGPWLASQDERLTVAYHRDDGDNVSLHAASRPLDSEPGKKPTETIQIAEGLPSVHTDFTHMTTGPEGPWVTWGDADAEEIRLVGPVEGPR